MNIKDETKEIVVFVLIMLLAAAIFSYVLFGITGARIVAGIALMSLPFYILLSRFELAEGEKFVLSILLGLVIFPSLVYILGLVVPFRAAIAAAFILFISISIISGRYKSKKHI